jgi:hypothetical protein
VIEQSKDYVISAVRFSSSGHHIGVQCHFDFKDTTKSGTVIDKGKALRNIHMEFTIVDLSTDVVISFLELVL